MSQNCSFSFCPAAAEAKHFSMIIWVPSIKTTWCVGILLSLACGDAEYPSKTCAGFGRVFTYQIQSGFKQDFGAQNLLWAIFIFTFWRSSLSSSHQAWSCSVHCQSLYDAFAREAVHNTEPAFPIACSAGNTPKGRQQTPLPVLPTGISKKDWACLSSREISCLLIYEGPGGTKQPSGPSDPRWQVSVGLFNRNPVRSSTDGLGNELGYTKHTQHLSHTTHM